MSLVFLFSQQFKDHCGIEEISPFDRGPFIDEYFDQVSELQLLIENEKLEIEEFQ